MSVIFYYLIDGDIKTLPIFSGGARYSMELDITNNAGTANITINNNYYYALEGRLGLSFNKYYNKE